MSRILRCTKDLDKAQRRHNVEEFLGPYAPPIGVETHAGLSIRFNQFARSTVERHPTAEVSSSAKKQAALRKWAVHGPVVHVLWALSHLGRVVSRTSGYHNVATHCMCVRSLCMTLGFCQ